MSTTVAELFISRAEADDYTVELSTGTLFYTGGWESTESLGRHIEAGDEIAGSYEQGAPEWFLVRFNPVHVVSITDSRRAA